MAKISKQNLLIRKNINLPVNLVSSIYEYAESMGLDFTNACIVLLNLSINDFKSHKNNIFV